MRALSLLKPSRSAMKRQGSARGNERRSVHYAEEDEEDARMQADNLVCIIIYIAS